MLIHASDYLQVILSCLVMLFSGLSTVWLCAPSATSHIQDMTGVDAAIIAPAQLFQASGHIGITVVLHMVYLTRCCSSWLCIFCFTHHHVSTYAPHGATSPTLCLSGYLSVPSTDWTALT